MQFNTMPKSFQETVIEWALNINFTLITNFTDSINKAPLVIQAGSISDLLKLNKPDKTFNKTPSFLIQISLTICKVIFQKEFGLYNLIINKNMSMLETYSGQDITLSIDLILHYLEAYILEMV